MVRYRGPMLAAGGKDRQTGRILNNPKFSTTVAMCWHV